MGNVKNPNISWQGPIVNRKHGVTLWFTGLSCSGKSTLAVEVEKRLYDRGYATFVLDGDNIRQGLNKDLSFSPIDREENIRRIGEVARLFTKAGIINLVAFISPYREDREKARKIARGEFIEIYCKCPLEVCERRDAKGLYKKARAGEILGFTGISAPYEAPEKPEITVDTDMESVADSVDKIVSFLDYLFPNAFTDHQGGA